MLLLLLQNLGFAGSAVAAPDVVTDLQRVLRVAHDDRVLTVQSDDRTVTVASDDRVVAVR